MTDLIIKNTRVIDDYGILKEKEILISSGKIKAIKTEIRTDNYDKIINAKKKITILAGIDTNVNFREPGFEYQDDWYFGSCSAAAGGVTTVIDNPRNQPAVLDTNTMNIKLNIAKKKSIIDYSFSGGVCKNIQSIKELYKSGVVNFGSIFFGNERKNLEISEKEFIKYIEEIRKYNMLISIYAENKELIQKNINILNYSILSKPETYSLLKSEECEYTQIKNCLKLNKMIKKNIKNTKLHFNSISSLESLKIIYNEKLKYPNQITCEINPQQLFININDYSKLKNLIKMDPPARTKYTSMQLLNNLKYVDIVASSHKPCLLNEKEIELINSHSGIPGVETLIPLMLYLVNKNYITLKDFIKLTSQNPAKLFNMKSKGFFKIGYDADLILFNPKNIEKIKAENLHYKCYWTPYENMNAIFPDITISRGDIIFEDKQIIGKKGRGRFISGPGLKHSKIRNQEI